MTSDGWIGDGSMYPSFIQEAIEATVWKSYLLYVM